MIKIFDETGPALTAPEIRAALGIDKLSAVHRAAFLVYLWWMQPELQKRKRGDDIGAIHRTPRATVFWFGLGVVAGLPIILFWLSRTS